MRTAFLYAPSRRDIHIYKTKRKDPLVNASDVMRTSIAMIRPQSPLLDAAQLLLETNQRALPVVTRDGELVGIISEGDFVHRVELGAAQSTRSRQSWLNALFRPGESRIMHQRMQALRVEQVMTRNPVSIDEEASLDEVVARMDNRNVSQLPVVCGGTVIGMISRAELLMVVERELRRKSGAEDVPVDT